MKSIYGEVSKDGNVYCKKCNKFISYDDFSTFEGFSDGKPTSSKEKAEDIVQEAFETVWKKAPDWTPKAKFTTWFYRVLVNMAHHSFRDRFRVYEVIDDNHEDETFSTEDYIIQNELGDAVKEALQEIPERQRIAITLFYYDELSQKQACEVMGISEGALESLLSRGRSALKKKFDKVSLE